MPHGHHMVKSRRRNVVSVFLTALGATTPNKCLLWLEFPLPAIEMALPAIEMD
jgi:hypothetical protein